MEQATAGQDSGPVEDWRGRALAAEARVSELEARLRVIRVVIASFDEG